MAFERARNKREGTGVAVDDEVAQAPRVGCTEGQPQFGPEGDLLLRKRLALRKERRELIGAQVAQAGETRTPRKAPDTDQAKPRSIRYSREPVQMAKKKKLIEQVVLEPEHDLFIAGMSLEPFVALAKARQDLLLCSGSL